MTDFNFLEGDLLVGASAEGDERVEDGENMYYSVVFQSEHVSLEFRSGIGGYLPVEEDHFQYNGQREVYYPYVNETQVTPHFQSTDGLDLLEEGVSLKYLVVEGELYVVSQNEITAYSPIFFHQNGVPYVARDLVLFVPEESYQGDDFLGIDSVDQPVQVENVETGYSNPVEYEVLAEIIENDRMNGLLKVEEPDDMLSDITTEL